MSLLLDLADNTAYIVSEMSSAVYETILSQVFILGDEIGTVGSNDFPQLYRNGPLQDDTQYTVFIRAFIPAISPSTVSHTHTLTLSLSLHEHSSLLYLLPQLVCNHLVQTHTHTHTHTLSLSLSLSLHDRMVYLKDRLMTLDSMKYTLPVISHQLLLHNDVC